jgi:hypothetical protein
MRLRKAALQSLRLTRCLRRTCLPLPQSRPAALAQRPFGTACGAAQGVPQRRIALQMRKQTWTSARSLPDRQRCTRASCR